MRSLIVIAITVLVLASIHVADGHIGVDRDGTAFSANGDEYLMCGKCVYDQRKVNAGNINAWYQLDCDNSATDSSKLAKLKYNCQPACGTCDNTVDITVGAVINAAYRQDSVPTSTTGSYTAASVQCCSHMLRRNQFAEATCDATPAGADLLVSYQPAGCEGSNGAAPKDTQIISGCSANGASLTLSRECSDNFMFRDDSCPATSTCASTVPITNDPCLKLNGTTVSLSTYQTYVCSVDTKQMCIRAVKTSAYTANMTTGTSDISALKCRSSGASFNAGAVLAAAVVAILVAIIA